MEIHWKQTVGQTRIKEFFHKILNSNQLGHAYLFAGSRGVGKFSAALELSLALLCESSETPCYTCNACRSVLSHSHPDFRFLFPIVLASEHKKSGSSSQLSESGWDFVVEQTRKKIAEPYFDYPKGGTIPVDLIRDLTKTINRGSHRDNWTIVILDGVDTLRTESANAMLKTLEEPPAKTLIILLTESIHTVLPTIRSRCQIVRFGGIDEQNLAHYLSNKYPEQTNSIPTVLSRSFGSVTKSETIIAHLDEESTIQQKWMSVLFEHSDRLQQIFALESLIDNHIEKEFPLAIQLIEALLEELRTATVRSQETHSTYLFSKAAADFFAHCSHSQVDALVTTFEEAIVSLRKHTQILMVFSTVLLSVMEIIDERK